MNKDYKVGDEIMCLSLEMLWSLCGTTEKPDVSNPNCLIKKTTYSFLTFTPKAKGTTRDLYDIAGEQTSIACCDEETVKIISIEGDKIKLLSLDAYYDNDFFYLSKDELSKATFCNKEA